MEKHRAMAGAPLRIPANTWNAVQDLTDEFERSRMVGLGNPPRQRQGVRIFAQNKMGRAVYSDCPVKIDGTMFDPLTPISSGYQTLNEEFCYRIVDPKSDCVGEADPSTFHKFYGIALESIPIDGVGEVLISGIAPVWLPTYLNEVSDYLLDIGGTEQFLTRIGSMSILWLSAALVDTTRGQGKWAIVSVSPDMTDGFLVAATLSAPSDGNGGFESAYDWVEQELGIGGVPAAKAGGRVGTVAAGQPAYIPGGGTISAGAICWIRPGKFWFRSTGGSGVSGMGSCPTGLGSGYWPAVVREWWIHPVVGGDSCPGGYDFTGDCETMTGTLTCSE